MAIIKFRAGAFEITWLQVGNTASILISQRVRKWTHFCSPSYAAPEISLRKKIIIVMETLGCAVSINVSHLVMWEIVCKKKTLNNPLDNCLSGFPSFVTGGVNQACLSKEGKENPVYQTYFYILLLYDCYLTTAIMDQQLQFKYLKTATRGRRQAFIIPVYLFRHIKRSYQTQPISCFSPLSFGLMFFWVPTLDFTFQQVTENRNSNPNSWFHFFCKSRLKNST